MISICIMEFESNINVDNGLTNQSIGKRKYSMELFKISENQYLIEWDIPSIEETEHIGIYIKENKLYDFDGVFELPIQAIKILRKNNIIVPKEFLIN